MALARNAAGIAGPRSVADLRADAWGHGAREIARTVLAAGIDRIIVDSPDVDAIVAEGTAASRVSHAGSPTVDAHALYGLPGSSAAPVMRLNGTVLGVKDLRTGEGVSYGYAHRAAADTRVALVTGGYAQGIVRSLGGRIDVAIAERRYRVVGRIAMDVCVVDVAEGAITRGDAVSFFGDPADGEPSLGPWAESTGWTIAELVTTVGRHALREYIA